MKWDYSHGRGWQVRFHGIGGRSNWVSENPDFAAEAAPAAAARKKQRAQASPSRPGVGAIMVHADRSAGKPAVPKWCRPFTEGWHHQGDDGGGAMRVGLVGLN